MKTTTVSRSRADAIPSARFRPRDIDDLQIRSILVPFDFSEASQQAIQYAQSLVREFGSELHFVHVFDTDYRFASMMALPLIVPELESGRLARRHLSAWAKSYAVPLRRENIHAIKGRPFEEICNLARKLHIDMIAMSTRGHTGLKHLTLGSTAERVVRYSPCPVLVVHAVNRGKACRRKEKSPAAIRRIAVPIDFSECSMKGLQYAKGLAKRFQAQLLLLHSVALQYYVTSDEYARYDFPMVMKETERAARQQLTELVSAMKSEGINVKSSLETGHAGEQICLRANEQNADLIVTATHGRTGLRHVLIGSTAEYVVRYAQMPVLVVPSHERPALGSSKGKK